MVFYVKKETVPSVFRVVDWRAFYYFSTTFGGLDLPHFAAFCRVMNFILGNAGQI